MNQFRHIARGYAMLSHSREKRKCLGLPTVRGLGKGKGVSLVIGLETSL